ncbi:MAG: hypothetical protein MRJ52_13810 [Nitrosomonas sp.]|nr:hypothetical protein [Nitrosomonas sp.]
MEGRPASRPLKEASRLFPMGTVDCRMAIMIRFESGAGLLPYQGGRWGPPIRFPGNPTYHSGIAAVLRPGEYYRVTPAPKAYSGLTF